MTLNEYAAEVSGGIGQGLNDVGRAAFADIANSYQEVLLADSPISAPEPLTADYETVTTETDLYPHEPPAMGPGL